MSSTSLTGHTLGHYEIKERLGAGGMGTVYRAYQKHLNRDVAFKVITLNETADTDIVQRFYREAQTAASLEHPNIVPVYDSGNIDGTIYLTMRLLTGGSLADRINHRRTTNGALLPLTEIAYLLTHLASALDYAHSRGVIHRDIKPNNIMFDSMGAVYLVDFGIAKLTNATALTQAGSALGTPDYMAPEAWRGEESTAAADQYALGVLAYLLVTGALPFTAPTWQGLMQKHLTGHPPSPRDLHPDLPDDIVDALERALEKKPERRFASVGAFAEKFAAAVPAGSAAAPIRFKSPVLPSSEPSAQPNSTMRSIRRRGGILIGVLALLVVAGLAGLLLAGGGIPGFGASAPSATPVPPSATLTPLPIVVVPTDTPSATPSPSATMTATSSPTWTNTPSPSPTTTPSPTATASPTFTASFTRTPTDTPSATTTASPTHTATATDTATHTLTPTLDARATALAIRSATQTQAAEAAAIALELTRLAEDDLTAAAFASATQDAILTATAERWTATPSPTPSPTTEFTAAILAGDTPAFLFHSNRDGDWNIYLAALNGESTPLTRDDADDQFPAWSPDGRQIAFVSDRGGNEDIWIMDADGRNPRALTESPVADTVPVWSPDGQHIAFVSIRSGNWEIYVMDADGRNVRNVSDHPAEDFTPSWSPDSRRLVFHSDRDGSFDLYIVDLDTGDIRRLTRDDADELAPSWSPNGLQIAFQSNRDGNFDIYTIRPDGSNVIQLTNDPADDVSPDWSSDGGRILFASRRDGNYEIYIMDADGRLQQRLTDNAGNDSGPAWKPQPELLLLAATEAAAYVETPTPTPDRFACPNAPPSQLLTTALARVIPGGSGVRMRERASTAAPQIGTLPEGGIFRVLNGPLCAEDFAWWEVTYDGVIGWAVEGTLDGYWLEPIATDPDLSLVLDRDPSSSSFYAVFQQFERGYMLYLQPLRQMWVLETTGENRGRWSVYEDTFREGDSELDPEISPPQGLRQPVRGFGQIWRTYPQVREGLGWATSDEIGFTGRHEYYPAPRVQVLFGPNGERFELSRDSTWLRTQ